MILSIDLGGTKIASALFREGEIVNRQQIQTPASGSSEDLSKCLSQLIKPQLDGVKAIAVASTGLIRNGILDSCKPQKSGWSQ